MRVRRITVSNFRGVKTGQILIDGHTLLVGSNSVGKSTLCEALDLVLGPERMYRRPVVDEYDFYASSYLGEEAQNIEIQIEVVLVDLSDSATRRFAGHLRKWDHERNNFADLEPDSVDSSDDHPWCLPVAFVGRFNPAEDDFEGGTFFAHPTPVADDLTMDDELLGGGRRTFTREDKRHCGYLYLRPNRTGSRALSLQRGSLLDTIIRLESNTEVTLWEKLREDLSGLGLATSGSRLSDILDGVESRIARFMSVGQGDENIQIYASDLTRTNIREVLSVFIANAPGNIPVPFRRLSTGSLNLLVFALLTYIAELKGDSSVIFAIEEPEMALPPHSQRRLLDFATTRMGQAIVTSHSPYVIERFEPENILVLQRNNSGELSGGPVTLPPDYKAKRYRENRRQFAEAVLARGVLVVEGATEASLIPVAADVLESDENVAYTHLDLAGVTIFDAGNDVSVPVYAPLFKSLGKSVYGMHDKPNNTFSPELALKTEDFTIYRVIPYAGVEDLLVAEMPETVKRRFLEKSAKRDDYPDCGTLSNDASVDDVDQLIRRVLKARKGAHAGYAANLVAEAANASELPESIMNLLLDIDMDLARPSVSLSARETGGESVGASVVLSTDETRADS
ncbi:ATP-dependent nuclease [Glutamicibacter arilaitensis]|uniref:ATP-dependent nuclease n=1 Tax=Glutamicibacter arilaitensis TaxID=256701 RepID=UPI003FCF7E3D